MVETLSNFPFRKLTCEKYLTLDVMMYIEYPEVLNFMFCVNKDTRIFIQNNFISINNGFINEGLITYHLLLQNDISFCEKDDLTYSDDKKRGVTSRFHQIMQLEKLYVEALKRNISNRIITV